MYVTWRPSTLTIHDRLFFSSLTDKNILETINLYHCECNLWDIIFINVKCLWQTESEINAVWTKAQIFIADKTNT